MNKKFENNLKAEMKARGWDVLDVAMALREQDSEASPQSVRNWMNGTSLPEFRTGVVLCEQIFHRCASDMLGLEPAGAITPPAAV